MMRSTGSCRSWQPSHVLPTGGTARFTSVLSFTKEGLAQMAPDVLRLAEVEGLTAHAASVTVRGVGQR